MIAILLLLAAPLLALDNAVRINTPSAVTARPISVRHHFHRGEIPSGFFPAPYVGGSVLATWQTDQVKRWADGSVESAAISFPLTAGAGATTAVEFRPDPNACSSGNRAACDSAGLTQAQMLAFNGGTWAASLTATANPQGSTTSATFDARAAVAAGLWTYWLRGPAVTTVIAGDTTSARSLDFGWQQKRFGMLDPATGSFDASATTINVQDGAGWAGLSLPFKVMVDAEVISICAISGNALTVGVSGTCPSATGRGTDGTSAAGHSPQAHGTMIQLWDSALYVTSDAGYYSTITINDASSITSPTVIQAGSELIRVCNKSGNTLTPGIGSWGCTQDTKGRVYRGSQVAFANASPPTWPAKTPVQIIDSQSDRWINAPSARFKTYHPRATLTFPTGFAGVGAQMILSTVFLDRMQSQSTDITISVGGSTVATITGLESAPLTLVRFPTYSTADNAYWAGSTPGRVRIDHNLAHHFSQGLLPWDPALAVTSQAVTDHVDNGYTNQADFAPAWTSASNDKCAADTRAIFAGSYPRNKGAMTRALEATGGRDELGLGKHFALWAYSWGIGGTSLDNMDEMLQSHANCVGQIPVHMLDATNVNFCDGWGYPANTSDKACSGANLTATTFGRILSPVAFPTACPLYQTVISGLTAKRFPVGPAGNAGFQTFSQWSHGPTLGFGSAAFSTDYYAWWQVHLLGGSAMFANAYGEYNPSSYSAGDTFTRGPWAFLNNSGGHRAEAWPKLMVTMAWKLALPDTPEQEMFATWLRRYWAQKEGTYNITDGSFYTPCPAGVTATTRTDSPWCYGRLSYGLGGTLTSWPAEPGRGPDTSSSVRLERAKGMESLWMAGYGHWVNALTVSWGFDAAAPATRKIFAGAFVRRTVYPGGYPLDLSMYQSPRVSCTPEGVDIPGGCQSESTPNGSELGFATMSGYIGALTDTTKAYAAPYADNDLQSGFGLINGAAFAMHANADHIEPGVGTLSWRRAWQFWETARRYKNTYTTNPYWIAGLRFPLSPVVTVGDTSARIQSTTMGAACKVAASTSSSWSADDTSDATATMQGQRADHVLTGLTAATSYRGRITCGSVRQYFSFTTTAAAGGATTISLQTAPRAGQNIATLRVDYGASEALGSNTSAACSTGCTVSVPGLTGRPLFYRYTWLDGGAATVAVGAIQRQIP